MTGSLILVGSMIPVFMMVGLYLIYHLTKFRTDIDPKDGPFAGRSKVWQVNVLKWSNYSSAGHPYVILLYAILGVLFASFGYLVLRAGQR